MNTVVCGLGYGDEGKGSVVDALCTEQTSAVVRFNGGPQAGHRVVMADGRDHVFSQWGAGTFRGIPTFHSRFVALDPMASTKEADHLSEMGVSKPYGLLIVDPECLIVTPYHKEWGRQREVERAYERHGSCGTGHGTAVEHSLRHPDEALRVRDILDGTAYTKLLIGSGRHYGEATPREIIDCYELWADLITIAAPRHLDMLAMNGDLIFEGAQGVLLDEWYGFHPNTTWSTCTFGNTQILLDDIGATATKLGVLRAFSTRHGAGPFVSAAPEYSNRWRPDYEHNHWNEWQGDFRIGYFDAVASRYACEVAEPDAIALTHLDNAETMSVYVQNYSHHGRTEVKLSPPADVTDLNARAETTRVLNGCVPSLAAWHSQWVTTIEDLLQVPVAMESWGPTAEDKRVSHERLLH